MTTFNRAQAATLFHVAMQHSKEATMEVTDTNSFGAIGIKVSEEAFGTKTSYRLHKSGEAEKTHHSVTIVPPPEAITAVEEAQQAEDELDPLQIGEP